MYWSRLEYRTKQVLDLLRYAAQERCRLNANPKGGEAKLKELGLKRKERDKQKKSLSSIEDLLSRGKKESVVQKQSGKENDGHKSSGDNLNDAMNCIYIPFCKLIGDRARMRMLWDKRENDWVFKSMPMEYKPIPVPFQFDVANGNNIAPTKKGDVLKEEGISPLSQHLEKTSEAVKQLGVAFMSQKYCDLPDDMDYLGVKKATEYVGKEATQEIIEQDHEDKDRETENIEENSTPTEAIREESSDNVQPNKGQKERHHQKPEEAIVTLDPTEHTKNLEWGGWKKQSFGLEMQQPWAMQLLNGKKTIETRSYDLPKGLVGKRIVILESQPGKDCVSSLGNILGTDEIREKVKIAGWVIFDRVIIYRYRAKFEADEKKHLVQRDSGYGWKEDTKVVYGWVVSKKGKFNAGAAKAKPPHIHSLVRRMRSLYSIVPKKK